MGTRQSLRHRLTASAQRLDAADLQEQVLERECTAVHNCDRGQSVQLVGRLRAVVYTPSATVPKLKAELFDGSDALELVWLGRRRIAGIEPGRRIVVRGRVGLHDGRRALYNPWYELLGPGT